MTNGTRAALLLIPLLLAGCKSPDSCGLMGMGFPLPLPGTYIYNVSSTPKGVDVYFNGSYKGKTPIRWQRHLLLQTVQKIELRATLEGYEQGVVSGCNYVARPSRNENAVARYWGSYTEVAFNLPMLPEFKLKKAWEKAQGADSVEGYEEFLIAYADSEHGKAAAQRLAAKRNERAWRTAQSTDTVEAYEDFLSEYPSSPDSDAARERMEALRADLPAWREATEGYSRKRIESFVEQHPDSLYLEKARTLLADMEGRNIVDLIKEGKLEAEVKGSGIQVVSISLRRLTPYPITVCVPVGAYFVSASAGTQNMVSTTGTRVDLGSDQPTTVHLSAACANRPKAIPGGRDRFSVRVSPHQAELAKLMPVLNKAKVRYAVEQAAVWIVTDDANYAQLGVLVSRARWQTHGGSRQINAPEAAQAMQICDAAGIDVTKKAIWRDRERILSGLGKTDLRKWIEDKAREVEPPKPEPATTQNP